MNNSIYTITKLPSGIAPPFDLLLLADETIEAIEKYIYDSDVYLVNDKEHTQHIAVFALYKIIDTEVELKNIAVAETLQGKGIGSFLINEIKQIAIAGKYKTIIVGTPDVAKCKSAFTKKTDLQSMV